MKTMQKSVSVLLTAILVLSMLPLFSSAVFAADGDGMSVSFIEKNLGGTPNTAVTYFEDDFGEAQSYTFTPKDGFGVTSVKLYMRLDNGDYVLYGDSALYGDKFAYSVDANSGVAMAELREYVDAASSDIAEFIICVYASPCVIFTCDEGIASVKDDDNEEYGTAGRIYPDYLAQTRYNGGNETMDCFGFISNDSTPGVYTTDGSWELSEGFEALTVSIETQAGYSFFSTFPNYLNNDYLRYGNCVVDRDNSLVTFAQNAFVTHEGVMSVSAHFEAVAHESDSTVKVTLRTKNVTAESSNPNISEFTAETFPAEGLTYKFKAFRYFNFTPDSLGVYLQLNCEGRDDFGGESGKELFCMAGTDGICENISVEYEELGGVTITIPSFEDYSLISQMVICAYASPTLYVYADEGVTVYGDWGEEANYSTLIPRFSGTYFTLPYSYMLLSKNAVGFVSNDYYPYYTDAGFIPDEEAYESIRLTYDIEEDFSFYETQLICLDYSADGSFEVIEEPLSDSYYYVDNESKEIFVYGTTFTNCGTHGIAGCLSILIYSSKAREYTDDKIKFELSGVSAMSNTRVSYADGDTAFMSMETPSSDEPYSEEEMWKDVYNGFTIVPDEFSDLPDSVEVFYEYIYNGETVRVPVEQWEPGDELYFVEDGGYVYTKAADESKQFFSLIDNLTVTSDFPAGGLHINNYSFNEWRYKTIDANPELEDAEFSVVVVAEGIPKEYSVNYIFENATGNTGNPVSVSADEHSLTALFFADEGYELSEYIDVVIDGYSYEGEMNYDPSTGELNVVDVDFYGEVYIYVYAEKLSYAVGYGIENGASIDEQTVLYEEGTRATIVANEGYTLPATLYVTMSGEELTEGTEYTYNNVTGEFVLNEGYLISDIYVSGVAQPFVYDITYNITNGTVTGDEQVVRMRSASAIFMPNTDYVLPDSITVTSDGEAWTDGIEYTYNSENGDFTIAEGIAQADVEVTAVMAMGLCPVRYEADVHGTLLGETAETIAYGTTPTAVPVPEAQDGYHFVKWTVSGSQAAVEPSTYAVTGETVFVAVFEVDAYNLIVTVSDYVSASYPSRVVCGDDITVRLTAPAGYILPGTATATIDGAEAVFTYDALAGTAVFDGASIDAQNGDTVRIDIKCAVIPYRTVRFVKLEKTDYYITNAPTEGGQYVVYATSNVSWSVDEPMTFTVYKYATFGFPGVACYVNNVELTPDENGVYTIPAGSSTVTVTLAPTITVTEEGEATPKEVSIIDWIISVFRKIIAFFENLFKA